MPWEAWFTVAVVVLLIISLARGAAPPDLLAMGSLTLIITVGELTGTQLLPNPTAAMARFASPGVITVAVLFIVVTGLSQTGAMTLLTQWFLGRPDTTLKAQLQLLPPVALLSAFLNNTPIVAMFMPVADDLCKKSSIPPARLFLPLSYAATFGGVCTLIGTSTNLILNDEIAKAGLQPLGMFDLAWVGVPCALAGFAYILIASPILLKNRHRPIDLSDDPRQYTVEMMVQAGGPLVGQSVEKAGLRHLPGLYLVEIDREGEIIPAVSPQERLRADDRLVFVGVVGSVVDLKKIRGLAEPGNQTFKLDSPHFRRSLIEAVVSDRCPLVGKTIRDGQFRRVYNAAVLAIARSGERLNQKLGDVVLEAGDTLLLESQSDFPEMQRNSPDFFLVSRIENSAPVRHGRAWIALLSLAAMVSLVTSGLLDMMTAALLCAGLMIVTRCCTGTEARRSVDISLLTVIGAALGLGEAMQTSTAATTIAETLVSLAGRDEHRVLIALYFVTMLFTELITNNAAAVLVFPIALASAQNLGVDPRPMIVAIMVAASAAFATPFGYQTNLMVYGPGGYKYSDYLRFGIPLSLVFMLVCTTLVPMVNW